MSPTKLSPSSTSPTQSTQQPRLLQDNLKTLIKVIPEDSQTRLYIRLLQYIKPYAGPFFVGLAAAVPSGSMDGIIAWLAGQGMQRIFIGTER